MNPRDALHHGKRAANKGGRSVWQTCYQTKFTTLATVPCFRVMASYLSKVANFNPLIYTLAPPLGLTPFQFCRDLRHQESRVPGLSCGVVCVILRSAVLVEHRFVTDRETGTRLRYILRAWRRAVKIAMKTYRFMLYCLGTSLTMPSIDASTTFLLSFS